MAVIHPSPQMNCTQLAHEIVRLCEDNGFALRSVVFEDHYGVHTYNTVISRNIRGDAVARLSSSATPEAKS